MPTEILKASDLEPGDIYEDCAYHPCLCISVSGEDGVTGISLIDGSYPRGCDIAVCSLRKLTVEEAVKWKISGPSDVVLDIKYQWWQSRENTKGKAEK